MSSPVTVLIPHHRERYNREWLQQAIANFPPGTPYFLLENDGDVGQAFTDGARAAETEFVLPFGADDVPQPGLLEGLLRYAWNADVVYPSMILTDPELEVIGSFLAAPFNGPRLLRWNYITGASLMRREKVLEVGGWRSLDTLEDWDLNVRLYRAGARFRPAYEAWFLYRQVPGSRNKSDEPYQDFRARWKAEIVGDPPAPAPATFYSQATPAIAYWRCQVPANQLGAIVMPDLNVVDVDGELTGEDHEGAAVWQYPGSVDRAVGAIHVLQKGGHRVLVEVDDNYLDESDVLTRRRAGWTLGANEGWSSVDMHRWITEAADGVIVTTPTLAEIYAGANDNVYVCPNQIEPADWPEHTKPDDGVLRLGWFASPSHDRDEGLIRRALSWASRQPNVEVLTMGHDPHWNFNRRHYFWSDDLAVYWRHMMELDVGLCPVERTGWSIGRSDLKALEYAMAGALPILSRQPCYDPWRPLEGEACLFASTAKDFEQHVRWCVRHPDEVREMASRARAYVLAERTAAANRHLWEAAIA